MTKRTYGVHPNSTAARKWGKTTWTTTLDPSALASGASRAARDELRSYFRLATVAAQRGEHDLARRLRAAGMRASRTSFTCG